MAAKPDQLHELLSYCMDFAHAMLKDSGEFFPFGATLSPDGEVAAVGGWDGNERPKSQEIYQLLAGAFISAVGEGRVIGVALAADVNVPDRYNSPVKDALRVQLEAPGFARFIYVPYELLLPSLTVAEPTWVMHEPFAVEIKPMFFPLPSDKM